MPKKGDDLESLTATVSLDHHANALIVVSDGGEDIPCIFDHPEQSGVLNKISGNDGLGIELDLSKPHAYIETSVNTLVDEQQITITKRDVEVGGFDVVKMHDGGTGLTFVLLVPSQAVIPGQKWQ